MAKKLGIKRFKPDVKIQPENADMQNVDEEVSRRCLDKICMALPYLFAAASLARSGLAEFKDEEALKKWQELSAGNRLPVRYLSDVWWKVSFSGLDGQIGKNSQGDIIFDEKNKSILFDSPDPPLIWFAKALSKALCGHEAFVSVFAQVLAAWPAKDDGTASDKEEHLKRLERDLGFSEVEVDEWWKRITAHTLSEEQVQKWKATVFDCLIQFGGLAEKTLTIGSFVVNRNTWVKESVNDKDQCTQQNVEKALEEAFNAMKNKVSSRKTSMLN